MPVDRDHVFSPKCAVCSQFKKMLVSMRNYRPAFVESTTNVRTTAFKDHAATDTHADAMVSLLSKKQQAQKYMYHLVLAYCSSSRTIDCLGIYLCIRAVVHGGDLI